MELRIIEDYAKEYREFIAKHIKESDIRRHITIRNLINSMFMIFDMFNVSKDEIELISKILLEEIRNMS